MTDRLVAPRRGGSRTALRVRRTLAALIVLVAALIGVDYAAAAATESVVSQQMRAQLGLADDPAVRINNFPFLTQAISGRYRSVDVTAQHIAVGPLRDLQVRSQLRDVRAPLSEMVGSGPRTLSVREAEGTVRIGAPDVERLLTGVDNLWIDGIDADGLEQAVEDGADPELASLNPANAGRMGGTVELLGEEQQVSLIVELQLTGGQVQLVPRDVRLGDASADPLPVPLQRSLSRLFTVRLDPGALPLQVTPTRLRTTNGGLEISGLTGRLVLGAGAPTG